MKRNPDWDDVIARLSALPVREGVYLAHENCPQTFTERNFDHPSMLGALGVLPGEGVDRETMRRTLHKVMKEWQWERTWGWDYPLTAMTAARLGEPELAIDALMMSTEKNQYLANGHNWQRKDLPCYLPGNGGLLYAIAMMAAGWQGAPSRRRPDSRADGSWTVRWENLNPSLLYEDASVASRSPAAGRGLWCCGEKAGAPSGIRRPLGPRARGTPRNAILDSLHAPGAHPP